MQHGPAGRQRIGRGAGRRGDDEPVCALVGDEVPVHLHAQLHHARGRSAVDHHIVERASLEHAFAAAHDTRMHQRAQVFLVVAFQHGCEGGLEALERNVGDEAQPALVDADQRRAVAGQPAAHAQHGAVATHHQSQIALAADRVHVQHRIAFQSRVGGGLGFQHHFAVSVPQELGDALEYLQRAAGGRRPVGALVFAYERDAPERRLHEEITSLK